MHYSLYYCI